MLVDELKPADVTALLADALHQSDWIGAEFLEMSMLFGAAGDPRNFPQLLAGHDSSVSSFSFWRSLTPASGASGWISMFTMKPPRGVSATKAMARARSA